MKEEKQNYELVKFSDQGFELEVNVSPAENTVWLTQQQMSELFDVDRTRITRHINNAIQDGEISEQSNVRKTHFTGTFKPVSYYDLDVIIAVGYRVSSKRGIIFRRWATNILHNYMLKGYTINSSRVLVTPENYLNLVNVVNRIDSNQAKLTDRVAKLEDKYPSIKNMLFFKGQFYDATSFIEDIIFTANTSIILIDGYIDKKTLDLLTKKKQAVSVEIFTSNKGNCVTNKEQLDFNAQYGKLSIKINEDFHDRFMIVDEKILYHIGASIKDAAKKTFEISVIEDQSQLKNIINRL